MTRCLNIDWLEVYCVESISNYPCNAEFFRMQGYFVHERSYGTKVWGEVFTLEGTDAQPLLEIRRAPLSRNDTNNGILPPEACHIRLTNNTCYRPDAIDILRHFIVKNGYELIRIFRIDICNDFVRFDKGDDPGKFMERYISGKYSKVNQSNISAHGTDTWSQRIWNSVSWGKPSSMISTKFYCKTLELQQVGDKPYIRQAWFYSGLIDDPINLTKREKDGTISKPMIWRVEFSIKSEARRVFKIEKETGKHRTIEMPHTLDMYDTDTKLLTMFYSLSVHYFHFKHYHPDTRKDRCPDKVLFEFSPNDTFYKIDRLASHKANTKPAERLITLLRNYYQTHPNPDIYKAVETICKYLEEDRQRQYLGSTSSRDDITLLRRLVAERLGQKDNPQLSQHIEVLRDLFGSLNPHF